MPKKNRPTGKNTSVSGKRQLTSQEYRVLADHAAGTEADQKRKARRERAKSAVGVPARQWTTKRQVTVANRQEQAHHRGTKAQRAAADKPGGDQFWNKQRAALIRRRNRNRRLPWYAPLTSVGIGLAGEGAVTLLETTTAVNPRIAAGIAAACPVVTAAGLAIRGERRFQRQLTRADPDEQDTPTAPAHRRFWPEVLAGAGGCSALVYWIALGGVSWLVILVILVGTSLVGTRWWKDNPLGPGVPALEPPRPAEPEQRGETQPVQVDEYAKAWRKLNGLGRLTNRADGDNTIEYDVQGAGYGHLLTKIDDIATHLGLDPQQVIPKQPGKDEHGWRPNNRARLSIVVRDVVAGQRYWNGPQVTVTPDGTAGVITNLARFRDGHGEAKITMWNRDGMVPTAVFGSSGGGKSAGINALAVAGLSTGLLNSIYVDFKGNSSGALFSRARIVVKGRDAARDVQKLMKLLTDVRIENDPRDKQFPTHERPGWLVFLDEITKGLKKDPQFGEQMEHTATTVRSLGMWLLASSQDMHSTAWHNTNTRAAFAKQAVVYYMNTDSDQLINGLTYKPSKLPTYDDDEAEEGQEEKPIAGFAVHVNTYRANIPCRWDWLPSDDDPVPDGAEPPYRVSDALDAFAAEPGIVRDEYDALVHALGPPNPDGRWIIGIGGTHSFQSEDEADLDDFGQRPVRTTFDFGTPVNQPSASSSADDPLTQPQRRVYELIAGGTTKRSELVPACPEMSASSLDRALDTLVADQWIKREGGRGQYAVVGQPAPEPV